MVRFLVVASDAARHLRVYFGHWGVARMEGRGVNEFDRYAPASALNFMGSVGMACWFGAVVLRGGTPITPDTYGVVVYSVPALVWVIVQIVFGVIAAFGFATRRRAMAGFGAAGTTVLLSFFAVMAMGAPQGSVLQAGAMMWNAPLCALAWLTCWGPHE